MSTNNSSNVQDHMTQSMNAMVLLNSSCQAIVETYIAPTDSPWYQQVEDELGSAQDLVRQWRLSGNLYFGQMILSGTLDCANSILNAKPSIDNIFAQLSTNYSESAKQNLITQIGAFLPQILALNNNIQSYEDKLKSWNLQMEGVQAQLNKTVGAIQEQEGELQADIEATNEQIASMQKTVEDDRKAIAKAKSKRTSGILETIFGVVLAPITGGASLILAGIGVASIVEAEAAVNALESSISRARNQIVADQAHLSDDNKQIVSLQGIVASANLVLNDVEFIGESMDSLRTDWELLHQNLNDVVTKINDATNAQAVILSKVWFDAACNEWSDIADFVNSLQNLPTQTSRISIG